MRRRNRGTNFDFEFELKGVEVEVKVEGFKPPRPAPHCLNPDDPRYSDPGDDAEWDRATISIYGQDVSHILPGWIWDEVNEKIVDQGYDVCCGVEQDARQQAMEEQYDEWREQRERF